MEIKDSPLIASLNDDQRVRLSKIKLFTKNLWASGDKFHPYFTLHGPHHCEQVEKIIQDILAPEHFIPNNGIGHIVTQEELFYLLSSAWLHDIGMIVPLSKDEKKKILREKISEDDWIRQEHHKRSNNYIKANWKILHLDTKEEAYSIGEICEAHRGDDLITDRRLKNRSTNNRLLGAILRVADELDITNHRTPDELMNNWWNKMDFDSKWHWLKHYCVRRADARHVQMLDEQPPIIALYYHYSLTLPSYIHVEPFWERIMRPIRDTIEYKGVDDILRLKGISINHNIFNKSITFEDSLLPDGKLISQYLQEFLLPAEFSSTLKSSLMLIRKLNLQVSELLEQQCLKLFDIAKRQADPSRIEMAATRFLEKLSNVNSPKLLESVRASFREDIRRTCDICATKDDPILLRDLRKSAYDLAELGWRFMTYVRSSNDDAIRKQQVHHLVDWLGTSILPFLVYVSVNDPNLDIRTIAQSAINKNNKHKD